MAQRAGTTRTLLEEADGGLVRRTVLPGGLRVVTRITETDPAALTFSMPMQLVADVVAHDDDGTEVVAWAFTAATDL